MNLPFEVALTRYSHLSALQLQVLNVHLHALKIARTPLSPATPPSATTNILTDKWRVFRLMCHKWRQMFQIKLKAKSLNAKC